MNRAVSGISRLVMLGEYQNDVALAEVDKEKIKKEGGALSKR